MASTIHCDIVSAEAEIFSGEAAMVVVSGEEGELGIVPRHAPLLTRLKPGQVRVMLPDGDGTSPRDLAAGRDQGQVVALLEEAL